MSWKKAQIDEELRKIQLRVNDKLARNLFRWQKDEEAIWLNEKAKFKNLDEEQKVLDEKTTEIYNILLEDEIQKAIRDKKIPTREEMWKMPEMRSMLEIIKK